MSDSSHTRTYLLKKKTHIEEENYDEKKLSLRKNLTAHLEKETKQPQRKVMA